jgi:hypothetical protein
MMERRDMDRLIEEHLAAEAVGDLAGSVAMYTDDIEHDVVGSPTGPVHGKAAAQDFYLYLTTNLAVEKMDPTRSYYGDDFCVIEHLCTATVPGEFMGIAGEGKRVAFRMLHVWEFKDGLMSRENVWLDGGSIAAQMTSPAAVAASA